MSIFRNVPVPCPSCGTEVNFEMVHSVNASRRPDLRESILQRTFQKEPCPACQLAFRMEPEFTYTDLNREQFFAVWPASRLSEWQALEVRSQQTFDEAFGEAAPPEARAIGEDLSARLVFGWPALSEKLLASEAGIADRTLELAKMALIRTLPELAGPAYELRLLKAEGEMLDIGWVKSSTEEVGDVYSVPRSLLDEVEAAPESWAELGDDITEGIFVDYRRLLLPAPAAA